MNPSLLQLLLLLFFLVSICVAIHGLGMVYGLSWVKRRRPGKHHHFSVHAMFWILVHVVYGLLILHLLQITVWAFCYWWAGSLPDFETSFYYSATSYSSVGYGDVVPEGKWRVVGAVEAVTGILMFGWSTGVLFSVVNHLLGRFHSFTADASQYPCSSQVGPDAVHGGSGKNLKPVPEVPEVLQ